MPKPEPRLPQYALVIPLFLLVIYIFSGTEVQANIQQQVKINQTNIGRTQQLLKQVESQYSATEQELKDIEITLQTVQTDLQALMHQQQTIADQTQRVSDDMAKLETQKTQQQLALNGELQLLYQLPQEDTIKLILNQQDQAESIRFSHYHQALQTARLNKMAEYQSTLDRLSIKTAELAELQRKADTNTRQLATSQTQLMQNKKQRAQLLQQYHQEQQQHQSQLDQLVTERDTLLQLLAEWEAAQQTIALTQITQQKGQLDWPVTGKIQHAFGSNRPVSGGEWKGIFIKTSPNQPVHAIHGGEVIFADWLRGYGLLCIIKHGQGVLSLYGHNSQLLVGLGDSVEVKQPIANTGNSGGLTQAGLYFEIRQQGRPKDPITWLSKK